MVELKRKIKKISKKVSKKIVIGWREWVSLPELGIQKIKVKIDSGARTSALHAFNIRIRKVPSGTIVQFDIHPVQHSKREICTCKAKLVDFRQVKDSSGNTTLRPVIKTPITIAGMKREIEVTLVGRDQMGFRMLLGRTGIKGKFLIDASKSFTAKD